MGKKDKKRKVSKGQLFVREKTGSSLRINLGNAGEHETADELTNIVKPNKKLQKKVNPNSKR